MMTNKKVLQSPWLVLFFKTVILTIALFSYFLSAAQTQYYVKTNGSNEIGCENVGKTTSNIIVRNNFIYNNDNAAIAMGGFDFPDGSGKVVNCSFINNTCFNNDTNDDFTGEFYLTYTENCSFRNNIFYANNSRNVMLYLDVAPVGLTFDYNLFYAPSGINNIEFSWHGTTYSSFTAYKNGTGNDLNSLFVNPSFVSNNVTTLDLHLMSNSAAIDRGDPNFTAVANETDIDGQMRVLMGRVDVGADEFGTVLAVEYIQPLTAIVHAKDIELRWQTANEIDHDFFIIEKSTDTKTWEQIGQKENRQGYFYQFFDSKPSPDISYYRLRQVSKSGEIAWSNMVSVFYKTPSPIVIYPNPTSDFFEIQHDESKDFKLFIELFDSSGQVALKRNVWSNQRIDVSSLPQGTYWLKMQNDHLNFMEKIVLVTVKK